MKGGGDTLSNYRVAILITTPEGVPLVKNNCRKKPLWKMPGGRGNINGSSRKRKIQNARQLAVQKVRNDLGINITEDILELVINQPRDTYFFVLFKIDFPKLPPLRKPKIGEEIKVFQPSELDNTPGFVGGQRKLIRKYM